MDNQGAFPFALEMEPKKLNLTREEVLDLRTNKGAWTRKTLEMLGVSWPPPKGWLEAYLRNNKNTRGKQ